MADETWLRLMRRSSDITGSGKTYCYGLAIYFSTIDKAVSLGVYMYLGRVLDFVACCSIYIYASINYSLHVVPLWLVCAP